MGTPGAEGGSGRRTGRKTGTAPWPDPTRPGPRRWMAARQAGRKGGGIPGRDRMPGKRTPAAGRQQENEASGEGRRAGPSAGRPRVTGRIVRHEALFARMEV